MNPFFRDDVREVFELLPEFSGSSAESSEECIYGKKEIELRELKLVKNDCEWVEICG